MFYYVVKFRAGVPLESALRRIVPKLLLLNALHSIVSLTLSGNKLNLNKAHYRKKIDKAKSTDKIEAPSYTQYSNKNNCKTIYRMKFYYCTFN